MNEYFDYAYLVFLKDNPCLVILLNHPTRTFKIVAYRLNNDWSTFRLLTKLEDNEMSVIPTKISCTPSLRTK